MFPEIVNILCLTLRVSGTALLISVLIGIGLGVFVALRDFPARKLVIGVINTGMGLPPVVVGLLVYLLLSRSGPLGFLGWLFTPSSMIVAQIVNIRVLMMEIGFSKAMRGIGASRKKRTKFNAATCSFCRSLNQRAPLTAR